mmetsp:Transcript_62157/g.115340  ORF Transcript_62157/g.115340 Transcript_62157/m.115340 type:complete len:205 (+) Transcript_62157:885-1499(+)
MCVDRRIPRSASETLVLTVRYVLPRLWVSVPLCEAEVDEVNNVCLLAVANEKVVWLDIPVDEVLGMKILNPEQHLICEHQDSLEAELPVADVEQVLKGRTKQVHNKDIIVTMNVAEMHVGDAWDALQVLEELTLIHQLRMFALCALQFNRQLLACLNIDSEVNLAKRAAPKLAAQVVHTTNLAQLGRRRRTICGHPSGRPWAPD